MNLHKNKIILFIVLGILALFVVFIIINIQSNNDTANSNKKVKEFSIWTTGTSTDKKAFEELIKDFKESNSSYKNTKFNITVFPDYLTYKKTLTSALINDKSPDVFSLNNFDNNKEVESSILGISSDVINPDYIRDNFLGVLGRDLILDYTEGEKDDAHKIEFLAGVPLGFDRLSLIYNIQYLRGKDLASWAGINSAITSLNEEKPDIVPIALGRGSGITNASDIFSQMLIQDGNSDLGTMQDSGINSTIIRYSSFGSTRGDNKFDNLETYIKNGQTDIDFLTDSKVAMMVGYLKDIPEIEEKSSVLLKKFLRVSPFPKYLTSQTPNLVSYNYFLINKNSTNTDLAKQLLQYFVSKDGQRSYAKHFQYSLPADLEILSEISENKISDDLVLKYNDFYDSQSMYTSFSKKVVELYDIQIPDILDSLNIKNEFTNFKSTILCVYNKVSDFSNLETSCGY